MGLRVSRKQVAIMMRQNGLSGARKRRFIKTTDSNHSLVVANNLLARDFTAARRDEKWVTDITYLRTADGWVYLAVVMDLFSRRVVGWATADTLEVSLPLAALSRAVHDRNPLPGLIHHSDRGSQYASATYQAALSKYGMVCSMSRKAECWDNAAMESLFGRLKEELVYRNRWESRAEVAAAVDVYFREFYNVRRRHSALDYCSPAEYELRAAGVVLAA